MNQYFLIDLSKGNMSLLNIFSCLMINIYELYPSDTLSLWYVSMYLSVYQYLYTYLSMEMIYSYLDR